MTMAVGGATTRIVREGAPRPSVQADVGEPSDLQPAVSVIIPAHDEEAVLPRCLESLLGQAFPQTMQIIIVANGCADHTARVAAAHREQARALGHELVVVEIEARGKPGALNAGDRRALAPVRVYLDADVTLSPNAIERVQRLLQPGTGIHLAAPRLLVRRPDSWLMRSYVNVWSNLPNVRESVIGCGFYAVSDAGRRRWTTFPPIISDDKFVRLHFAAHERRVIDDAHFTIRMSEPLREHVSVRSRWCRGNAQLRRLYPELAKRETGRHRSLPSFIAANPGLWIHLPVFVVVYLLARIVAWRKRAIGMTVWERADSTRPIRLPAEPPTGAMASVECGA